ncbi:MAG: DNA-binding protein [Ramlibacter sp.]|nr:DNA-binding protein [Ramlibacter sp.]
MVTRRQSAESHRNQALTKLREAGISIPEWAAANNFSPATVKAVLYGHSKALRGEGHRVAVALGIKAGLVVSAKGFTPVRRVKPRLTAVQRVDS